ncbi:hypothetical protein JCM14469_40220 [Desulfatiferula olefinivorans]
MMTKIKSWIKKVSPAVLYGIAGLWVALGITVPVSAWELGHYSPGLMNVRDFIQPAAGNYFVLYAINYSSDTVKGRNGDTVKTVTSGPLTINLDMEVDSTTLVPTFLHITDNKIWGGNYGFLVAQPVGNPSFQASLELANAPQVGTDIDESSWGIGDTYVRPLWLSWNRGQVDLGAAYGLYIPIGKYDSGAADNVGLGMWTHEFMANVAYYVDQEKGTALTLAGTYEIHHKKDDVDVTPGSHFTVNYGVSQFLPVTEKVLSEVGIAGFGQWQVTRDRGSDALDKDVKDQVYGLGLQAGMVYLPWGAQVTLKWSHEFEAKHRFEGDFFTVTGVLTF